MNNKELSQRVRFSVPGQWKPTREQIAAAEGRRVRDIIAPGLKVLFCGINPGLYSGAVGHHFARPGNRFWPALFASGFTERLLSPFDERALLARGLGITNLVARATGSADVLTAEELVAGAGRLRRKVRRFRPRAVAFLGISAYRIAFARPQVGFGRQEDLFAEAEAWLLPNPSGLNAHFQLPELARLFEELRTAIEDRT